MDGGFCINGPATAVGPARTRADGVNYIVRARSNRLDEMRNSSISRFAAEKQWLILSCLTAALLGSTGHAAPAAGESSWSRYYAEGETAVSEQKLAQAEESFRQALAAAEGERRDEQAVEKCTLRLADILTLRDKTGEAQVLYQRLLDTMAKRYGSQSPRLAPVLMALGSIQEAAGDHASAMSYYTRVLAVNEKHYGPYSPAVAGTLHKMGRAAVKSGRGKEAESHYKRALSILMQQPGLAASTQMESLMRDYADLLKGSGNSSQDLLKEFKTDFPGTRDSGTAPSGVVPGGQGPQPELPLRPAIATAKGRGQSAWQKENQFQLKAAQSAQTNMDPQIVLRGIHRPYTDQSLAPAYRVLSETIFNQSHFEKGEDYYKRMIAIDRDSLGTSHPSLANDLTGLALLYMARQRYAEAQPLLASALSIYEQNYGSSNLLTISARTALAATEFNLGHIDRAAELYRNALSQGQSSLGPNSFETASILNELAYLYYHQGRLDDSCTFYEWALASTERAVGNKDPLVAACLIDYAQVLRGLGRAGDAERVETRAQSILAEAR